MHISEVLLLLIGEILVNIIKSIEVVLVDRKRRAILAILATVLPRGHKEVDEHEYHGCAVADEHSNGATGVRGRLVGAERLGADQVACAVAEEQDTVGDYLLCASRGVCLGKGNSGDIRGC